MWQLVLIDDKCVYFIYGILKLCVLLKILNILSLHKKASTDFSKLQALQYSDIQAAISTLQNSS